MMRTGIFCSFLSLTLAGCDAKTVDDTGVTDAESDADADADTDADTDADADTDTDTRCEASLTLRMPDGTSTTLDYCVAYSMDASFEFDPDKPPEVRAPTLKFHAVVDGDFQCSVTITEPAVCGPGYYRMDGSSGEVKYTTFDCSGVGDAYEGVYRSSTGYLHMTDFAAGDVAGDLSGTPLMTTMAGAIAVASSSGIHLNGDFTLRQEITAGDSEEADCVVSDGDEDNDGYISDYFGGDDPDDADPTVPGDADADTDADTDADADADADTDTDADCHWEISEAASYTSIRASGTELFMSDDSSREVDIGFEFDYFFDEAYSEVSVVSNGFIRAGGSGGSGWSGAPYSNMPLASSRAPHGIFALLWDDLNPSSGGGIFHETTGTAPDREFTVEWDEISFYGRTGQTVSMQVILSESGGVLYKYADVATTGSHNNAASATIGVNNELGDVVVQHSHNEEDAVVSGEQLELICD